MTTTTTTTNPSPQQLIQQHGSKSNAIRYLASQNYTRSQIAKALGIRYQHVRNVLITPIKKAKV